MSLYSYEIHPVGKIPELGGLWDGAAWNNAQVLEVSHFRPEGSDHRPRTQAKLLHDLTGVYGIFRVFDKYVKSIHRRHQDPVFKDSCVEFFIQPRSDCGYFNFEFNCGGTLLASYVVDHVRTKNGAVKCMRFTKQDVRQLQVYHSQPKVTDPEITENLTWHLEFFIPYKLLEKYTGRLDVNPGMVWRGNLYKCGDETSHPHWASWSPVDDLNFHLPHCFGEFTFK